MLKLVACEGGNFWVASSLALLQSRRNCLDLSGIGYGQIHWDDKKSVVKQPFNYYYFLACITRISGARRIIEVGTHWGGSARAMATGLISPEESVIVTFDITSGGAERLKDHPVIRAHTVDANSSEAIEICFEEFGEPRVDLIYIDSNHTFWPTLLSFCIYKTVFSPTFVILDDITLIDEMQRFWNICLTRHAENAIDCSAVVPEIAPSGKGFGIVRVVD